MDLSEAPVGVGGDDRGDELSDGEGAEEGSRGTLHEEESVRTSNEDEGLGDDGNLEVDDHVDLVVVDVGAVSNLAVAETNAELVVEEGGLADDDDESDGGEREPETVGDGVGEDLGQVPRVGGVRGQDTVNGEGHDGTVVEERDDKDHERREVELVGEGEDTEADDDTDGDGAGVDRVVAHTLEDDTGSADGMDDGGETGLSQDDIGSTTGGVGGTLDGNTDVGTGQSGSIVGTVTSHSAEMSKTLETKRREAN